jgi:multicomponent Na+:H+ antiporter subunit B
MPPVGDADSPANSRKEVAEHYLEKSGHEVGPPNVVTSVLGDYRGYDTMGETTVIFTAALCVLMLLRQSGMGRPGRGGRRDLDA